MFLTTLDLEKKKKERKTLQPSALSLHRPGKAAVIWCPTSASKAPGLSGHAREAHSAPPASFLNELTFLTLSIYFLVLETASGFDPRER